MLTQPYLYFTLYLFSRVVYCEHRQDDVGRHKRGLLLRICRRHKHVDVGKQRGRVVRLEAQRQAVKERLAGDGGPLGGLVQKPRHAEPDLADDGCEPERVGGVVGVAHAKGEEENHHDEAHQHGKPAAQRG